MREFPGLPFMGPLEGINPARMAPEFVRQEVEHYMFSGEFESFAGDSLSTIGKVKTFKPRPPLGSR
jgi:hypothetical protein